MKRIRTGNGFLARITAVIVGIATLITPISAPAQGDLLIAPTRLILDGRRGGQVILSNIGEKEATYRITMELRRMTAEGGLEDVPEDEANSIEQAALAMVRYAPRRITLPPDQPQAVRISARPPAELPDGEYRIHLAFNAVPESRPVVGHEAGAGSGTGLAIRLIPIYGITMPIIIRKGQVTATAGIANPRIEARPQGGSALALDLSRSGNGSTFGEIRVTRQGGDEPLYLARGIAIYPEIDGRKLYLPLTKEQAASLKGALRFEYRETSENGGGLLAAVEAVIP